jgi:hypothetical protein
MAWAAMIGAIEHELAEIGLAHDQAKLLAWVEAMQPHIDKDPDPERWAREYGEMVRERQWAASTS